MAKSFKWAAIFKHNTLGDLLLLNNITLLLRFANVLFLVSVPLLHRDDSYILGSLPLLGFAGITVVTGVLFSRRFAREVMRWVWSVNLGTGLLLALFGGMGGFSWAEFYYLFAILLGISLVGTETANLLVATSNLSQDALRRSLSSFYALKIFGMALGFLLGGFIAGSDLALAVSRGFILAAGGLIGILGVVGHQKFFRDTTASSQIFETTVTARMGRGFTGLLLIAIDLAVFTFWYAYLPFRMTTRLGVSAEIVALFLALQTLVNAGGQLVWRRIVGWVGEIVAFWLSFLAHVGVVFFIGEVFVGSWPELLALCLLMGLLNSGTSLAATAWYYSAAYPSSMYRRIALHQVFSNAGKWLGTTLAVLLLTRLN